MDDVTLNATTAVCSVDAQVGNLISCFGICNGTAFVSETGTAPFAYTWNNGGIDFSISNICVGTYTVTLTDAIGCTASSSVTLSQPAVLTANALVVTNATCYQCEDGAAQATVLGGTTPYNYFWSNGETTNPATAFNPGTFTLLVVDENGCQATDTFTVNDLSLGMRPLVNAESLIYPNPVGDYLSIAVTKCDVFVFDLTGRECMRMRSRQNERLNVASLAPGFYTIRINTKHGSSRTSHFIKE